MQYCNVKLPLEVAWMDTDDDVEAVVTALVGEHEAWDNAMIGYSSQGPYEEGDVSFKVDGEWFMLAYDFMMCDGIARVFRMQVWR